ncbi:MAG: hypothetical protein ACE5EQ_12040 [Phycisphaerae bacterium]
MTRDDPVVERVRAARRRIVAECQGDAHKIYEWAKAIEAQYPDRLVGYDTLKRPTEPPLKP